MGKILVLNNNEVDELCEPIMVLGTERDRKEIEALLFFARPTPCNEFNKGTLSCPYCGCILDSTDDGIVEGDFCPHCGKHIFVTTDEIGNEEFAEIICPKSGANVVISKKCKTRCENYEECLKKANRKKVKKAERGEFPYEF